MARAILEEIGHAIGVRQVTPQMSELSDRESDSSFDVKDCAERVNHKG